MPPKFPKVPSVDKSPAPRKSADEYGEFEAKKDDGRRERDRDLGFEAILAAKLDADAAAFEEERKKAEGDNEGK